MDLELPPHVRFPGGPADSPCPACGGEQATRFYEVLGIPVHSCVLLDNPQAAREFPLADLSLAHCPDCGFLYNESFRPESLDYSDDYQESQGASATFRAFLDATVRTLAQRTDLAGKPVVEVGCGRGDFLALLARAGATRAIGIDPSSTAGSLGPPLEMHHKPYDSADYALPAHLIACRHTLEHLPRVQHFVAAAREHLAKSGGEHLFVEVPNVLRVLREGAFWDIYYEHCSYFTLGSLERLAVGAGFRPQALELVYAGQYIQLTASAPKPAPGGAAPQATVDDLEAIQQALATFQATCQASLRRLRAQLQEVAAAGQGTTCLWGAGSKATGLLTTLGAGDQVAAVVDIDPAKQGKYVAGTGHPIIAPGDLPSHNPAQILVMNPIYTDEIQATIDSLDLRTTPAVTPV